MNFYINNINVNTRKKWYHYTSMELFVEFCINFAYFIFNYCLFIFELSSADIYHVLFLIFSHLSSESCQSVLRLSKWYFDKTKLLSTKMQTYWSCDNSDNSNTAGQKVQHFILQRLKDESNLNEWRIRHSLDFSIRCVVLILSFVLFGMLLVIIPHDAWLVSHKSGYENGILYFNMFIGCI